MVEEEEVVLEAEEGGNVSPGSRGVDKSGMIVSFQKKIGAVM